MNRIAPGLLEPDYEVALSLKLTKLGPEVRNQVGIPLVYDEINFNVMSANHGIFRIVNNL